MLRLAWHAAAVRSWVCSETVAQQWVQLHHSDRRLWTTETAEIVLRRAVTDQQPSWRWGLIKVLGGRGPDAAKLAGFSIHAGRKQLRGGVHRCITSLQEDLKKMMLDVVKYSVSRRRHRQIPSCCGPENTKQTNNREVPTFLKLHQNKDFPMWHASPQSLYRKTSVWCISCLPAGLRLQRVVCERISVEVQRFGVLQQLDAVPLCSAPRARIFSFC